MIDQLHNLLVQKLLESHRYKKNLITNERLEQEIIILSCFYGIRDWIDFKDWIAYSAKINLLLTKESNGL